MLNNLKKKWDVFWTRRVVQVLSLIALNSSWGPQIKWFCNPVLNCHSCVLAWFACPVGVFIQYSGWHLIPFFAIGTVLLMGLLFGRLFCGWVCPFGFLMDLLFKIPTKKCVLPKWTSYIKYVVLLFAVILFPFFLGPNTSASFCRWCPASALQVTLPRQFLSHWADLTPEAISKLSVLVFILFIGIFCSRFFCKVLCPIAAILAPLNYISFWFVKRPPIECIKCGRCDIYCVSQIHPSDRIKAGGFANRSGDCIGCNRCAQQCPLNILQPKQPACGSTSNKSVHQDEKKSD